MKRAILGILLATPCAWLLPAVHGQQCRPYWREAPIPMPGFLVRYMVSYDDGTGPALYGVIGPLAWKQMHRWKGEQWEPVNAGLPSTLENAFLHVLDDGTGPSLYMTARYREWFGSNWDSFVLGPNNTWEPGPPNLVTMSSQPALIGESPLYSFDNGSGMAIYGQVVVVPGQTYAPARWDGTQWQKLSGDPDRGGIRYASFDDGSGPSLYVCGHFHTIGGVAAHRVARWDGVSWQPLGNGPVGAGMQAGGVGSFGIFEDDPHGPSHFVTMSPFGGGTMHVGGGHVETGFAQWVGCPNCYANCDGSTTPPILTVDDFTCFIDRFAAGDPYANCTQSSSTPYLTIDDFTCFINAFAQGCP